MKNQQGFTLIELVVVIVILGILAAVAVPKFVDMQVDARVSAVEGLQGALVSAASLAHAQHLVKGTTSIQDITMGGGAVEMSGGYPDATTQGIAAATTVEGFAHDGSGVFTLGGRADCGVTYANSGNGIFPGVTIQSSGCN